MKPLLAALTITLLYFLSACASRNNSTTAPLHIITTQQWGSAPQALPTSRRHTPKYITIHHAGEFWKPTDDPQKKILALQKYGQREKNWPDLPYHFMIAPDGRIFEGRSLEYEPESNTKYDLQGNIGVELWGNFEVQRVSQQQLDSLVKLCASLCERFHIDPQTLRGHKDLAQTACPGKDLYRYLQDRTLHTWVTQSLKGQSPKIQLKPPLPTGPTTMITTGPTP